MTTERGGEPVTARRAVVRGRVQGVFFRATAARVARDLGVTGWVRNDPTGTVTIHAEGPEDAVASLLTWAGTGPRDAVVAGVEVRDAAVEGHAAFGVSYG